MQSRTLDRRTVLYNLALIVAYVSTAKLGLQFAYAHGMATLIWMPTGISLAAVLLGGYRLLPGVALGAFATVATAQVPLWVAVTTSIGNTLEAFVGAFLLTRLARFDISLARIRDIWYLLLFASLFSTLFSATIGVAGLCASGVVSWSEFPSVWQIWWLGNVISNLLVAPLILVWSHPPRWHLSQVLELSLVLAVTWVMAAIVFGEWLLPGELPHYPLSFAMFPLLIWAALRCGQHGSTAASFSSALLATWWTLDGRGPYAAFGIPASIALLWIYVAATTLTALVLATSLRERYRAEQETEHAYMQLREIINNAPQVAIQGYDTEGRVLFWNKTSEEVYGFREEEVIGKRLTEFLLSDEDARRFAEVLQRVVQTGKAEPLREWETRTADGEVRYVLSSLFPIRVDGEQIRVVCMDIDVTERKRLEAEVLRAHKLDSIGRMAGGIAHDFNNLLTAIMSYADMALVSLPDGHPAAESIQHLIDTANRAAEMTKRLLAFARRQSLAPQIVDLNELVRGMVPILDRLVGEQVELKLDIDPVLKTVTADPAQLEQVVLNLVVNARDSMPAGGVITIQTANVVIGEAGLESPLEATPGEYVKLSINDTGTGIAPEHLEHIFDPFYSTKETRGTGLGLAVVYGVVKQSGGHIEVESKPGRGTTFHVYLPAASGDSPAHTPV